MYKNKDKSDEKDDVLVFIIAVRTIQLQKVVQPLFFQTSK